MSHSYVFKFIIVGDTGVGKSCLLLQFIDNRFRLKHQPTIGVEFGAKSIEVRDQIIKLQVWDTAGQESFKSITRGYYRSAAGAILVYDITNRQSFENIENWLNQAQTNSIKEMSYVLIGNKCDVESERNISFEEGALFAKKHNLMFMETSSKTAYNVMETFKKLCEHILNRIEKGDILMEDSPPGIKLGNNAFQSEKKESVKKKKKCCF